MDDQSHFEGNGIDNLLAADRIKPPPMVHVVLLNDDFTPMDFVVVVLQKFFGMTSEAAFSIMFMIHKQGRAVCGTYPRDIAATKVEQVLSFAKAHQHPLACVMEEKLT